MAELLKLMTGAEYETTAACGVSGADAAAAHDESLGGEVGALDVLHQITQRCLGIIQHADAGADDLTEIVRRDIGGQTHGDTGRAVHQQVGEARRQNAGLLAAFIEVGIPIHGILVDVPKHLVGDFAQTSLGITVSGRRIAIYTTEVTMTVHQHIAHGEILGQTHQSIVYGSVTVRVIAAQHVTHAGGGLLERLVGCQVILVHGVEDAAMYGLKTVAHIGQSTSHDDTHGVLNVRLFHLRYQRRFYDMLLGVPDFFGIILGLFGHLQYLLSQ